MTEAATLPAPKRRGPNTPEGKARSAMNARKHGLRARDFVLLPEEDPEEWRQHVRDLMEGYRPVDATEEKLVTAIAAAIWKEIRADRFEAEVLADIPPRHADRSHGSDLQPPDHAASLTTAIRYATAAGTATRRAQRAFLEHRKAKQAGLVLTARMSTHEPKPANDTNDLTRQPPPVPPRRSSTNDFTDPLAGLDWFRSRDAANGPASSTPSDPPPSLRTIACTSEPDGPERAEAFAPARRALAR